MPSRIALIAVAVCFSPVVAWAQPAEVTRVLRTFDFEERSLGNPEELPMHWAKVQGPGFPHYVNGRLTTDRAHGGKYSFRLDLNGGSVLYRLEPTQIRIQPGAHYRVEGWCQTTVLQRARARIAAYVADLDGHLLGPGYFSAVHAASGPDDGWSALSTELTASDPRSAYLILEIGLLQPEQYATTTLGKRALFNQDIRGSAWFDDIRVWQMPRVVLKTDKPGNVFNRDEPLRLRVMVSDRFTEDLAAQVVLHDADGREVYQRSGALDMTDAQVLAPGRKRMSLDLPDLKPGWYQASLNLSSHGEFLAAKTLDLIRLPDDGAFAAPDQRFGTVATALPFEGWEQLPQILPYLATGRVKLAVWNRAGDVQQVGPAEFDSLLERLRTLGITPTACLVNVPPSIAAKLGGSSWDRLLRDGAEGWQSPLAYLISRHANHLDRWQLGEDGSEAFVDDPNMKKVYDHVYGEFSKLIKSPDLAMPWPASYDLPSDLPATVALSLPPSVLPAQIPLYTQDLRGREGHNLSLSLELLDRQSYGREAQIRDLAERLIYALASDTRRIDLPLPFTVEGSGEELVDQPRELFMILRTLTCTLSGAEYRGRVPLAEGVEAFCFDRKGQGIIALWNRGNTGGVKQLALNLGHTPVAVDLWGNVTPLLRAPGERVDGNVRLDVGSMPFFLIDIDGAQAQLRASVGFDQPLIESTFQSHSRHLRFHNPYRSAISGTLKLKPPPGWTLNPPTFAFSLNPGEDFDRQISIEFPYNSYAGRKTIDGEFAVQAESLSTFTVPLDLNLGLSDVGMQAIAVREGQDVIVQQTISNYGEAPIDYSAFCIYPGQARQERMVSGLSPGRTTLKRYRFVKVPPTGVKIRVGLKEQVGMRILNDEVPIQ